MCAYIYSISKFSTLNIRGYLTLRQSPVEFVGEAGGGWGGVVFFFQKGNLGFS